MARKILCVAAGVLLIVFLAINIVALYDSIEGYGISIIENPDGSVTSKTGFIEGIRSPLGWLKLLVLILYIALAIVALINIFKKSTVLTSVLLGGSVFAGVFFLATKLTYLFGTSYFMTVRYYLLDYFMPMSYDKVFAFQDVVYFWSYMLVAVLLAAVLVMTFIENKKTNTEQSEAIQNETIEKEAE